MVEKFGQSWDLLICQVELVTLLTDGIVAHSFTNERFPGSTLIISNQIFLLKSFFWITSVYLNFRHGNFTHKRTPWLRKYLMHCHPQIFIQGRITLKNNSVYFLAICTNFPCKIEKFELEVVGVGTLGTGFCF